jgi:hypothetical protein
MQRCNEQRRSYCHACTAIIVPLIPKLLFSFVDAKGVTLNCYMLLFDRWADNLARLVDKVLDTLMELEKSSVQHDRMVFDYVLNHLFSEIECFLTYTAESLNQCDYLFCGVIGRGSISDSEALGDRPSPLSWMFSSIICTQKCTTLAWLLWPGLGTSWVTAGSTTFRFLKLHISKYYRWS